ncbi:MAG: class I adenylate-forming enzyme family protein [Novosphingobium sp.]|nr:acyl--CoA ligase [Novosphingobium sp.]
MAGSVEVELTAIVDRLTAHRSIFERDVIERDGIQLPVFKHAPQSLPDLFGHYCDLHRDNPFLVDGDIALTYGQVHALARRAAAGLIERHGVRPGDRVGIAGSNSANWIIAYMATLMAGGCATLLNGWWTGHELAEGVKIADCAIVLADGERAARLKAQDQPARIVPFGHGQPDRGLSAILAEHCEADSLPEVTGDDLATILFTSGSTGRSKAAWSDHRAVINAAMNFAVKSHAVSISRTDAGTPPAQSQSALLSVPLFHVIGEVAVLLLSFFQGRRLVIMPKWDAKHAMELIQRERITFFIGVPLMSYEIATHPERESYDLSSCESFAAGGAARPIDHLHRIGQTFPEAIPMLGYGLTETNCVGCTNVSEHYLAKPASTGPASTPLVEIAIFGSEGNALPAGKTGEIAIRSVCNSLGYWNDPKATNEAFRPDGFFLSGDIGYLDEDGFLFVVDRMKDIIIRGGENIACTEVERAIYKHPDITEVSVFGLPHERYGEVPVAVYRTKTGVSVSERELRRDLKQHLAKYKIPVRFWEEKQALPRLGTQKIDKLALKARYSENWEDARSAA